MDSFDYSELSIEAIYQMLGSYILNTIDDDDWKIAIITAEIEDDDSGLIYGRYSTHKDSNDYKSFETHHSLYFAFDELRQRLSRDDSLPWQKAQFILERDGKFDLIFDYPDENPSEDE